jgi:hypothetical protein
MNQLHKVCNDVYDEYYGIKTNTVADVVIKINRNPPFKLWSSLPTYSINRASKNPQRDTEETW